MVIYPKLISAFRYPCIYYMVIYPSSTGQSGQFWDLALPNTNMAIYLPQMWQSALYECGNTQMWQSILQKCGNLASTNVTICFPQMRQYHFHKKARGSIQNPGSQNPGSQNPGSQNPGSQNPGSPNPGSQNPGSQNPVVFFTTISKRWQRLPDVKKVAECLSGNNFILVAEARTWRKAEFLPPNLTKATILTLPPRVLKGGSTPWLSGSADSKNIVATERQQPLQGWENFSTRIYEQETRGKL